MNAFSRSRATYVIGVDGAPLSLSDLPAVQNQRWTISHKANMVAAVRGGLISLEGVCQRYSITMEEFLGWSAAVDRFGIAALGATRFQQYGRPKKKA